MACALSREALQQCAHYHVRARHTADQYDLSSIYHMQTACRMPCLRLLLLCCAGHRQRHQESQVRLHFHLESKIRAQQGALQGLHVESADGPGVQHGLHVGCGHAGSQGRGQACSWRTACAPGGPAS